MAGGHNKGMPHLSDADYLAKLISRCTVTATECWEINGFRNKMWGNPREGYGYMCFRGKYWIASRLSWFLHKGEIPKGMDVMHTCDNPPCCNPAHLRLGTRQENIRDCVTKGRQASRRKTHCPRGHAYAEHASYHSGPRCIQQATPWRQCKMCALIRYRQRAGWPAHLWEIPRTPKGQRPASTSAKACEL